MDIRFNGSCVICEKDNGGREMFNLENVTFMRFMPEVKILEIAALSSYKLIENISYNDGLRIQEAWEQIHGQKAEPPKQEVRQKTSPNIATK